MGERCELTAQAGKASEEDAHHVMNHISSWAEGRALHAGCVPVHVPGLPRSTWQTQRADVLPGYTKLPAAHLANAQQHGPFRESLTLNRLSHT